MNKPYKTHPLQKQDPHTGGGRVFSPSAATSTRLLYNCYSSLDDEFHFSRWQDGRTLPTEINLQTEMRLWL